MSVPPDGRGQSGRTSACLDVTESASCAEGDETPSGTDMRDQDLSADSTCGWHALPGTPSFLPAITSHQPDSDRVSDFPARQQHRILPALQVMEEPRAVFPTSLPSTTNQPEHAQGDAGKLKVATQRILALEQQQVLTEQKLIELQQCNERILALLTGTLDSGPKSEPSTPAAAPRQRHPEIGLRSIIGAPKRSSPYDSRGALAPFQRAGSADSLVRGNGSIASSLETDSTPQSDSMFTESTITVQVPRRYQ